MLQIMFLFLSSFFFDIPSPPPLSLPFVTLSVCLLTVSPLVSYAPWHVMSPWCITRTPVIRVLSDVAIVVTDSLPIFHIAPPPAMTSELQSVICLTPGGDPSAAGDMSCQLTAACRSCRLRDVHSDMRSSTNCTASLHLSTRHVSLTALFAGAATLKTQNTAQGTQLVCGGGGGGVGERVVEREEGKNKKSQFPSNSSSVFFLRVT